MDIIVLKQAIKELEDAPKDLILAIRRLFSILESGKILSMPVNRSLSSIEKGLNELRLKSQEGQFRVFYYLKVGDAIYIIHAAKKKKQKIDLKTIALLKNRIKGL